MTASKRQGPPAGQPRRPRRPPTTPGAAIAWARYHRGLTREALAHRVGRSYTWLAMIEENRRAPTAGGLFALAQALEVDPANLPTWPEATPPAKKTPNPRPPLGRRPDHDDDLALDLAADPAARRAMLYYADLIEAAQPTRARAVRLAVGRVAPAAELAGHNRATEAVDVGDPSALEIARRADAIRRHWTEADLVDRAHKNHNGDEAAGFRAS